MSARRISALAAVAAVVVIIVLGLLVSFGIVTPEDSKEGVDVVSTITAGFETVVPLVETADATGQE